MRHYEILGNNCIPYFVGLEDCPKNTLANLPKELLLEARELARTLLNAIKYMHDRNIVHR
jgi:serine/threonine protein kinase